MLAQMSFIEQYYEEIKSGRIVACDKIKKQFKQLVDDIYNPKTFKVLGQDGEYHNITFVFDPNRASEPIEFIETFCKQSKAPFCGKPLKLMLWQKAIVQSIYGFVGEDSGYRRYKEVLLEISRKAGKSTLMSALAVYHMTVDSGVELCVGANTRSQAEIIFTEARNMIDQNPTLSKRMKKRKYDLYCPSNYNIMKPVANNGNLDGLNTDLFFADEIAEYKATIMYDRIKGGQGVKYEPLRFLTSSGGFERDGFFDNKIEYAEKVLYGIIEDPVFLSFMYELDNVEDKKAVQKQILDRKMWAKVNPSLGEHRSYAEFDEAVKTSQEDKSQQPEIYAKYFNLKVNGVGGWLSWDELNNEATFDIGEFRDQYFLGGFDLSEINDLTCGTMLFMKPDSDTIFIHQMYWIPEGIDIDKKSKEDNAAYRKWIEKGWVRTSPGSKINVEDVFNWFCETIQQYNLYPQWQGFDRWKSKEFVKLMTDAGIELEDIPQGMKTLSAPMKELAADFRDKKINYQNNPVLKWCLMNTRAERDSNGNIKPSKKNAKRRIDGLASLLDAYVVLCNHRSEFLDLL